MVQELGFDQLKPISGQLALISGQLWLIDVLNLSSRRDTHFKFCSKSLRYLVQELHFTQLSPIKPNLRPIRTN